MFKFFVFIVTIVFFAGCGTVLSKNVKYGTLTKQESLGVDIFLNLTDTPMAGNRAATVINSVLMHNGYKTQLNPMTLSDDAVEISLSERLQKAKNMGLTKLLVGEVIEWRYKTGIDGEPAVSLAIRVYDTQSGEVLFSSSGSKNGLGYSSLGIVAHDVAESMLP